MRADRSIFPAMLTEGLRLRRHYQTLELAIVEANKLDHRNANWLDWVRRGAESARVLADELARIVKQAEG